MKTAARLLSLLLVGAAVGGCQSQRPIERVMEDGLEAYDEGDYATARTDFEEYVDRRPADHRGRYQLGRALLAVEEPTPASEHLWVAYDLDPGEPGYLDTLAQALFEAERYDDLYRLLSSLTTDPGTTDDYLRLGRYAARLGDADQAEPALITAVKIDKGQSATPLVALAEFYRSVGDEENETRALVKAYQIDPANEEVAQRLRDLGETPGPTLAVEPGGDW